ncbi:IclR family transcriptional regulator [Acuticoccus mangrovi]|uniref:IclR family transcriptional regulator n=1 Tax=Acuticoccus mangrovi TaxID=2796142 RepID=A0A934MFL8_9HYPH|nr:IclR family transcriptional regulator [Acuticoccus mangrovi]MBJ3775618.1 IclR family transcriptional regulator [Acuticoccus mangrovi]
MKTVRNAISVLNAFSLDRPEMSLAELSARVGIDKVIVHRLLRTMKEERFVEQDPSTRHYRLGPAVGDLAAVRRALLRPIEHAADRLLPVHAKLNETIHLAQLEGGFVVVTFVALCTQELRTVMEVGERLPIYCTGPGLIYLAYGDDRFREMQLSGRLRRRASNTVTDRKTLEAMLPGIREAGLAVVDGTYSDGSKGISSPIFGADGRVIGVASVLGPSSRLQGADEARAIATIKDATLRISKRHGYRPPDADDTASDAEEILA